MTAQAFLRLVTVALLSNLAGGLAALAVYPRWVWGRDGL
jgi:hypothetical protein